MNFKYAVLPLGSGALVAAVVAIGSFNTSVQPKSVMASAERPKALISEFTTTEVTSFVSPSAPSDVETQLKLIQKEIVDRSKDLDTSRLHSNALRKQAASLIQQYLPDGAPIGAYPMVGEQTTEDRIAALNSNLNKYFEKEAE